MVVCPAKIESFAHGGSATKVLPAKGRLVRMVGGLGYHELSTPKDLWISNDDLCWWCMKDHEKKFILLSWTYCCWCCWSSAPAGMQTNRQIMETTLSERSIRNYHMAQYFWNGTKTQFDKTLSNHIKSVVNSVPTWEKTATFEIQTQTENQKTRIEWGHI